jgi:hypothetical protein
MAAANFPTHVLHQLAHCACCRNKRLCTLVVRKGCRPPNLQGALSCRHLLLLQRCRITSRVVSPTQIFKVTSPVDGLMEGVTAPRGNCDVLCWIPGLLPPITSRTGSAHTSPAGSVVRGGGLPSGPSILPYCLNRVLDSVIVPASLMPWPEELRFSSITPAVVMSTVRKPVGPASKPGDVPNSTDGNASTMGTSEEEAALGPKTVRPNRQPCGGLGTPVLLKRSTWLQSKKNVPVTVYPALAEPLGPALWTLASPSS